jgi:hypothetical protein
MTAKDPGLTVETAAIRIGEAVFTLPRPNRHHNVMWWLHVLGITSGQIHDQGFVLSDGTYANRIVAARAAKAAGQVVKMVSPPHLFSEDLWDGGADLPSVDALKALTAAPPPEPPGDGLVDREVIALDVAATVSFVDHGPMCRDCADEDGICPSTHLPCEDAEKAIRYVVERINYGLANGFITLLGGRSDSSAQSQPKSTLHGAHGEGGGAGS